MDFINDDRIILLLDAGGTNFVFTAFQNGREILSPITKPSNGHDLDLCLHTLITGFEEVIKHLSGAPVAISFAFPGPADYPNGIIGDLANLPAFRGGVALGPILEAHFGIPVFINNDGDLFAYGEALAGILPEINQELEKAGNPKRYKNLIGITLGTGFGAGIVLNNQLLIGDNSAGSEVWIFSNRINPEINAEEGVSTRAIQNWYSKKSGTSNNNFMPKDIYDIAMGNKEGDAQAARYSFNMMGMFLGDVLANLLTLIDGIAVIGGGMAAAKELYMPAVINEMKGYFNIPGSDPLQRIVQKVYNYENEADRKSFLQNSSKEIIVPNSNRSVTYDSHAKLAIATSNIGASKAIALGAYTFALQQLR